MVYSTRFVLCLTLCYFVFVFSVLLALRLTRLQKRQLILVLFARLFDLPLFDFICFLFLLVSGKGCALWLWNSLDFSLTFFWLVDQKPIWPQWPPSWKSIFSFCSRTERPKCIRVTCRSKIAKLVPIGNQRWPLFWKSVLRFFSWIRRPIDTKLGWKHNTTYVPFYLTLVLYRSICEEICIIFIYD